MQNLDMLWNNFLNCAGLVVIGVTVIVFMLCMIVSFMTVLRSEPHEARPLLTFSAGQDDAERAYALPPVVF